MAENGTSSDDLNGQREGSSHKMDDSTVNKLIPQMFDQMRSNLGVKNSTQGDGHNYLNHSSQTSVINTQTLLKELDSLDKIIPMIQAVDNSLQKAVPSHLTRIHEICKSTNAMLDSWINIQSQAGYINDLMNSEAYLKYTDSQSNNGEAASAEDVIAVEQQEIESLKRQIAKEEEKRRSREEHLSIQDRNAGTSRPSSGGRVTKGVSKSKSSSRVNKPSGIPNITSRLARPTVSSSRKMFR